MKDALGLHIRQKGIPFQDLLRQQRKAFLKG
jgi:hypothetical protein